MADTRTTRPKTELDDGLVLFVIGFALQCWHIRAQSHGARQLQHAG
jgi:hypothetical protein